MCKGLFMIKFLVSFHHCFFEKKLILGVRGMVFNATFKNISVILWWSVLLVEETEVPRDNQRPVSIQLQTLSHKTHPDLQSSEKLFHVT
jgi:hypothetical protein